MEVVIYPNEIRLVFCENSHFLGEFYFISILLDGLVDVRLVDFFVNHLFLGGIVVYGDDFDPSKKVDQIGRRDYL